MFGLKWMRSRLADHGVQLLKAERRIAALDRAMRTAVAKVAALERMGPYRPGSGCGPREWTDGELDRVIGDAPRKGGPDV